MRTAESNGQVVHFAHMIQSRVAVSSLALRWIVSAWMPWMAASDATEAAPRTWQQSIFSNGHDVILTARRMKTTRAPQHGTEDLLVAANKNDGNGRWDKEDTSWPGGRPEGGYIRRRCDIGKLVPTVSLCDCRLLCDRVMFGCRISHEPAAPPLADERDSFADAIRLASFLISERNELR